jgi:putative lipoprotein
MRSARFALYSLLPLFAACQVWTPKPTVVNLPTRVQGELSRQGDALILRPCQENRRFGIEDSADTGLAREARELFAGGADSLFVDVRGTYGGSRSSGTDGALQVDTLYRIQNEGHACDDPNFKRTIVQAGGNEPGWSVMINAQGLLLERPGQKALVVPYVVESVPGGSSSYSSEANGQKLELWVAPARCVNSMSGAVSTLSAELRLNGQVLRGCAYPGGASSD